MTIETTFPQDDSQWNKALLGLPGAHALQTAEWAAFKARHGWQTRRLLFHEGERGRAVASVLVRRGQGLPWGVGYAPKGPCLDDQGDQALWQEVLAGLEALARRGRLVFLKIDPDVELAEGQPGEAVQKRGGALLVPSLLGTQ